MWKRVGSELRKWAQALWRRHREVYTLRYLVESLVGDIAQIYYMLRLSYAYAKNSNNKEV